MRLKEYYKGKKVLYRPDYNYMTNGVAKALYLVCDVVAADKDKIQIKFSGKYVNQIGEQVGVDTNSWLYGLTSKTTFLTKEAAYDSLCENEREDIMFRKGHTSKVIQYFDKRLKGLYEEE